MKDVSLAFWYQWLSANIVPPASSTYHSWWSQDKDNILLDEAGVLIRLTTVVTSARSVPVKQLLVPASLQDRLLFLFHGHHLAGHNGISRTYFNMKSYVYWPAMQKSIAEYIAT